MQSKLSKIKETFRGAKPSTGVEQICRLLESLLPDGFLLAHRWGFSATRPDHAPSEAASGTGDAAMSAIETSLAVLKEASAFAGKIPYISPVAGLLLQALTTRDASSFTTFRGIFYLTPTFNRR